MERTRTEYFCDQCGKEIVTEHESGRLFSYEPRHIRLNPGGIGIQTPYSKVPDGISLKDQLDFCSFRCLERYITNTWTEAWLNQINEDRRESGLQLMKIGEFGFLERVEEEPDPA